MSDEKKHIDEKIAEALGIEFASEEVSTSEKYHSKQREIVIKSDDAKGMAEADNMNTSQSFQERLMEIDFIKARDRTNRLLDRGEEMFEDAYRLAQETDSPNGFGVANEILKGVQLSNKEVIKQHEQRAKIRKDVLGKEEDSRGQLPGVVNNQTNNFIGTTADLLDLLEKSEPDPKEVINEAIDEND